MADQNKTDVVLTSLQKHILQKCFEFDCDPDLQTRKAITQLLNSSESLHNTVHVTKVTRWFKRHQTTRLNKAAAVTMKLLKSNIALPVPDFDKILISQAEARQLERERDQVLRVLDEFEVSQLFNISFPSATQIQMDLQRIKQRNFSSVRSRHPILNTRKTPVFLPCSVYSVFEDDFQANNYISTKELARIERLQKISGKTADSIFVWFDNRRARQRSIVRRTSGLLNAMWMPLLIVVAVSQYVLADKEFSEIFNLFWDPLKYVIFRKSQPSAFLDDGLTQRS
jgi:hypothetical protein